MDRMGLGRYRSHIHFYASIHIEAASKPSITRNKKQTLVRPPALARSSANEPCPTAAAGLPTEPPYAALLLPCLPRQQTAVS